MNWNKLWEIDVQRRRQKNKQQTALVFYWYAQKNTALLQIILFSNYYTFQNYTILYCQRIFCNIIDWDSKKVMPKPHNISILFYSVNNTKLCNYDSRFYNRMLDTWVWVGKFVKWQLSSRKNSPPPTAIRFNSVDTKYLRTLLLILYFYFIC